MNKLQKKILKKCGTITKEIDDLHIFRMKQKRLHGDLYRESWLCTAVNFRIARLVWWKGVLKWMFRLK